MQREAASRTRELTKDTAVCGLFAALIAIGAFIRITIPVQPYPMHFTLQWFFVLLAGLLLPPRQAFSCVGVYLAIGLVGVPVFASGGGPAYVLKPTFGFLLGFLLAAGVIALIRTKIRGARSWSMLLPAVAGLCVYYGMGILYFYFISNYVLQIPVAWGVVLVNCCLLTIGEDMILCVLAALTAAKLKRQMQ